ncbi:hypothetical protein Saso_57940 [Streptomyces asoensis]|uniref:Uncharacterized protein n=1 Tax=Streptomyces asoensis TaxID=249586 RepID=A0ABQ3S7R9_9ACTN|nr:hypothetical protein GCM10010496_74340 [Streptomyces asoensis]GHI64144.1 hypothetical protein Saso_57940 [Streptomyces asoensis]
MPVATTAAMTAAADPMMIAFVRDFLGSGSGGRGGVSGIGGGMSWLMDPPRRVRTGGRIMRRMGTRRAVCARVMTRTRDGPGTGDRNGDTSPGRRRANDVLADPPG